MNETKIAKGKAFAKGETFTKDTAFAKTFAALRRRSGITQRELGERLGVSNRAVSKWETGLALPSTENVYKLAKIFNVPVDYFFSSEPASEVGDEPSPTGMKSLTELYLVGRGPSSSHVCSAKRIRPPTASK